MPTSSKAWVPIALLLRPQGRRGEILSEPLSDLADIFAAGTVAALAPSGSTNPEPDALQISIEDHWFPTGKNAGRIVLKLSGCNTISEAEALSGNQLLVPAKSLPALAPDTFFVGDLLGCDIYDGPALVGRVVDVQFATGPDGRTRLEDAAPLLAIELLAGTPNEAAEPTLVPFVRAWLDTVDVPARRIVMRLPAGLLDSE